jgi:hypothetical protein
MRRRENPKSPEARYFYDQKLITDREIYSSKRK